MNPFEKWIFIRELHSTVLKIVGAQFMDQNYRIHLNTCLPIFIQFNYYSLLFYTLFYYRNEPQRALMATPIMGFFIPVR